jgi:hypothetical protein
MSSTTHHPAVAEVTAEHPVAVAGRLLVRYGLVVVAWIGVLKYTTYEGGRLATRWAPHGHKPAPVSSASANTGHEQHYA